MPAFTMADTSSCTFEEDKVKLMYISSRTYIILEYYSIKMNKYIMFLIIKRYKLNTL